MKILFVSSGNSKEFEVAPFVRAQAEDLKSLGLDVEFYTIKGKGIIGYVQNISRLRKRIKQNNYKLIHAHYVLSAWVVLFTFTHPKVVCSFMGSDTYGDVNVNGKITLFSYINIVLAKIIQPFLASIIVKSKNLEEYIYRREKCNVIPNGVNFECFYEMDYHKTRTELGLEEQKKYILFLGSKDNLRKNFKLLEEAYGYIKEENIEILAPYPVPRNQIVKYLNAADVLAFTSYLEGSPNLVKESMACNLPVVSVDVGDTEWLLEGVNNCKLSKYDPKTFSKDLLEVLSQKQRSNGKEKLSILSLESSEVAKNLIKIYKTI